MTVPVPWTKEEGNANLFQYDSVVKQQLTS